MPFVQRDDGKIVGAYANRQDGFAEEWVPDNDEEVLAFVRLMDRTPALTARQLRLGLVLNGFTLQQVEAAVSGIEDANDRAVAEIEWEYASQFDREHPLIEQVGGVLGLTPEQIDTMWLAALAL